MGVNENLIDNLVCGQPHKFSLVDLITLILGRVSEEDT